MIIDIPNNVPRIWIREHNLVELNWSREEITRFSYFNELFHHLVSCPSQKSGSSVVSSP